jgi:hypothetical protein
MKTSVFLYHPNKTLIRSSDGSLLGDFCNKLKYNYIEGLENDECEVDLVFTTPKEYNSFILLRGQGILLRYGVTGSLTPYRHLVIDVITKKRDKAGIGITLTLLPLTEYQNRSYPMDPSKLLGGLLEWVTDGITVKFELRRKVDFDKAHWCTYIENQAQIARELLNKPTDNIPGYKAYSEEFLNSQYWGIGPPKPKDLRNSGSIYKSQYPTGGWIASADPDSRLAIKEITRAEEAEEAKFKELFTPNKWSADILDFVAKTVEELEALEVDVRDNKVVVKEVDLEQSPIRLFLAFTGERDNVISYELSEHDKAIAFETGIQNYVEEATKKFGVVRVSTLPSSFQEVAVHHVGKPTTWGDASTGEDFNPNLVFRVLSDGESLYTYEENSEFAKKLTPEDAEFLFAQGAFGLEEGQNSSNPLGSTRAMFAEKYGIMGRDSIDEASRRIWSNRKYRLSELQYPFEGQYGPIKGISLEDPEGEFQVWDASAEAGVSPATLDQFNFEVPEDRVDKAVAFIKDRFDNYEQTFFPYTKEGLVNKMVKATTDEAMYKNKITLTVEGDPFLEVGKIIYLQTTLRGDSGRYYVVEIEDTLTKTGFQSKITGLKIPDEITQLHNSYLKSVTENWGNILQSAKGKVYNESNKLIKNTIQEDEGYRWLTFVPDVEIRVVPAEEDSDETIQKINTIPQTGDSRGPR